ncbi:unnamed protein product [Diplocarpon coronariae]
MKCPWSAMPVFCSSPRTRATARLRDRRDPPRAESKGSMAGLERSEAQSRLPLVPLTFLSRPVSHQARGWRVRRFVARPSRPGRATRVDAFFSRMRVARAASLRSGLVVMSDIVTDGIPMTSLGAAATEIFVFPLGLVVPEPGRGLFWMRDPRASLSFGTWDWEWLLLLCRTGSVRFFTLRGPRGLASVSRPRNIDLLSADDALLDSIVRVAFCTPSLEPAPFSRVGQCRRGLRALGLSAAHERISVDTWNSRIPRRLQVVSQLTWITPGGLRSGPLQYTGRSTPIEGLTHGTMEAAEQRQKHRHSTGRTTSSPDPMRHPGPNLLLANHQPLSRANPLSRG